MKNTKKTIIKGSGSSFRAAGNVSTSVETGIFAYLDIKLALETSSHLNTIFTHFGTAGPNFGAICIVQASGNYYGGIAFSYDHILVHFNKKQNICTIDVISS